MGGNQPFASVRVNGIHRAAGVLIRRDLVLVPSLSREVEDDLRKEGGRVDVYVTPPDGEVAEVIKSSYIEAHGLQEGELVGAVHLERPSSFSVPRIAPTTSRQLAAEIERHGGDISKAILASSGVSLDLVRDSSAFWVNTDAKKLRFKAAPGSAFHTFRHNIIDDVAINWCECCLPVCQPTDGDSDP